MASQTPPAACRILVVDDEPAGREVLSGLLASEPYEVLFAESGRRALDVAAAAPPDLMLLDVMMPDLDGYEVCRAVRTIRDLREIPIIMVTALDDRESRLRGLESGADDFVSKPFDRFELRARINTIVRLNRYRTLVEQRNQVIESYERTLEGWIRALDMRDHETEGHTRRVTTLTVALARLLGVAGEQLEHVRRGAMLHDIGKIGVPDAILNKPGRLTPEERQVMERHPVHGRQMLEPVDYLRPALDIPSSHHERWDGSGYPDGLAGEAIPRAARIFSVVDVYDALISERPYKRSWSREEALAEIQRGAGTQFDPEVVAAFVAMILQRPDVETP